MFTGSKTLSGSSLSYVRGLVTPQYKTATLCYRASDNKFSVDAFHKSCDSKGATVTVIKSESGQVFGGYTA